MRGRLRPVYSIHRILGILAMFGAVAVVRPALASTTIPSPILFPDLTGVFETYSATGSIDLSNPFFQNLGTNGRTCAACHALTDGWSITPADAQARFVATQGQDPLFRPVDEANSPLADVSTVQARQVAYSMLLTKGLTRIGLPMPANAEFTLSAVDDPYHFASSSQLSLFRRPLPAADLLCLTVVLWDGRETGQSLLPTNTAAQNQEALLADLEHQALSATFGHSQATTAPSSLQLQQIATFELALATAQQFDSQAGRLDQFGATGGAAHVATVPFYVGMNDSAGGDPKGNSFNPQAMTMYAPWASLDQASESDAAQQASIARGESIFNTRTFSITGVGGLNDVGNRLSVTGTCTSCHDTPNMGNHSLAVLYNTGVADGSRRTQDMPLYTLQNVRTGETVQTTDPGRALITGKWADVGKFKVPVLHNLAPRAPYFHNGSAATLTDVVNFYNQRFNIDLSTQDIQDLVNFLNAT